MMANRREGAGVESRCHTASYSALDGRGSFSGSRKGGVWMGRGAVCGCCFARRRGQRPTGASQRSSKSHQRHSCRSKISSPGGAPRLGGIRTRRGAAGRRRSRCAIRPTRAARLLGRRRRCQATSAKASAASPLPSASARATGVARSGCGSPARVGGAVALGYVSRRPRRILDGGRSRARPPRNRRGQPLHRCTGFPTDSAKQCRSEGAWR